MLLAQTQVPSPGPASSEGAPRADQKTTMTAVDASAPEQSDGMKLMVAAYVVVWVVLMLWLMMMWSKGREIAARLNDLDRAIDRAAAKAEKNAAKKPLPKAESSTATASSE